MRAALFRSGLFSSSLLLAILTACSGDGLTGAAPAQAILDANFDKRSDSDCSIQGSSITYGRFADSPVPILDGSQGEKGVNHVACKVVQSSDRKTFEVDASLKSDDRVVFAIKGTFPATTDTKGFKVPSVTLSNADPSNFVAYTQADGNCTVLYATDQEGVSAGRVWGEVTCATATLDGATTGNASGTCTAIAEFRFEDCARD